VTNIFEEHLPPIHKSTEKAVDLEKLKGRQRKREVVSLAPSDIRDGQLKLKELTTKAFETLETAMNEADFPTAVSAAKLVLDRAGFGPSQTIKVEENLDLSGYSSDELKEFAARLAGVVKNDNTDTSLEEDSSTTVSVH
jgi:hypothetical protein